MSKNATTPNIVNSSVGANIYPPIELPAVVDEGNTAREPLLAVPTFAVAVESLPSDELSHQVIEEYINYVYRDSTSVKTIIDVINSYESGYLFIFCDINNLVSCKNYILAPLTIKPKKDKEASDGSLICRSRNENWLTIAVRREGKDVKAYINGYLDISDEDNAAVQRYYALKGFLERIILQPSQQLEEEIHPRLKAESIADALNNIWEFSFTQLITPRPKDCSRLIVERLQGDNIIGTDDYKEAVIEDILYLLDKIKLKSFDYVPDNSLLGWLAEEVLQKDEYSPKQGEKDLRLGVIKLFYDSKKSNNKLVIDSDSQWWIDKYFEINILHYTESLFSEAKKFLLWDPRNSEAIEELGYAAEDRASFLKYQASLSPSTLSIARLGDFFAQFSETEQLEELKEQVQRLEDKLSKAGNFGISNAYNKAHTSYWYSAEDIAIISSELFKRYQGIRFTQAIDENALADVVREYLASAVLNRQPTLIPLNIRGNHWVAVAIIPKGERNIILYKDSLGDLKYELERESVKVILQQELNIKDKDFIFHAGREQEDDYSCGIFAIANLNIIAHNIARNIVSEGERNDFINNFTQHNFTDSELARSLRWEEFPRLYALSFYAEDKKRAICSYHEQELEPLSRILTNNHYSVSINGSKPTAQGQVRVSIGLPNEEQVIDNNYCYLYIIEVAKASDLESIKQVLQVSPLQTYSSEGNSLKIYGRNKFQVSDAVHLESKSGEEEQVTLLLPENRVEELLASFGVIINEENKNKLKKQLGLPITQGPLRSEITALDEQIEIHDQKASTQRKIDYLSRILEVRQRLKFDELIIALSDKLENPSEQERNVLSAEAISTILAISMQEEELETILATIKILTAVNQIPEKLLPLLREFCQQALPKVPKQEVNIVIELGEKLLCQGIVITEIVTYVYQLLLDHEDQEIRSAALGMLKSYSERRLLDNYPSIEAAIALEDLCSSSEGDMLGKFYEHVQAGRLLTINCCNALQFKFDEQKTYQIIITIINRDIQKVPAFFINSFKSYINQQGANLTINFELVRVSKALIEAEYISLIDILPIVELGVEQESLCKSILDIILATVQCGHYVPKELTARLTSLYSRVNDTDNKAYLTNIIRLITREESNIDILMNHKNSLSEREQALASILADERRIGYTPYVVKKLAKLVQYDPDIRDKAFNAILAIVPDDYSSKGFVIDLAAIINAIYGVISIEDIIRLANKDLSADLSVVIDLLIYEARVGLRTVEALVLLEKLLADIQGKSAISIESKNEGFDGHPEARMLSEVQIVTLFEIGTTNDDPLIRSQIFRVIKEYTTEQALALIPIARDNEGEYEVVSNLGAKIAEFQEIMDADALALDNVERLEVINQSAIKHLERVIAAGYLVDKDKITLLINSLLKPELSEFHSQIAEMLLQIDVNQGSTDDYWLSIATAVNNNDELIKLPNIVNIITIGIARGYISSDTHMELISEIGVQFLNYDQIRDQSLKEALIAAIEVLSFRDQGISDDMLKKLALILINRKEGVSLRVNSAEIIVRELNRDSRRNLNEVIENLKGFILAVDEVGATDEVGSIEKVLTHLAFLALKKEAKEGKLEQGFLTRYYGKLKASVIGQQNITETDLEPLSKYLTSLLTHGHDLVEGRSIDFPRYLSNQQITIFYILDYLSSCLVNGYIVDTEIFRNFSPSELGKETLCSKLLQSSLSQTNSNNLVLDLGLTNFRACISCLDQFGISEEDILSRLIELQNVFGLNLTYINDILSIIKGLDPGQFNEAWSIVTSNDRNFYFELRKLFLKVQLTNGEELPDEDLVELNIHLLPYEVPLIANVLAKQVVNQQQSIGVLITQLISFFCKLNESGLTIEEKRELLAIDISSDSSIASWMSALYSKQVKLLLQQRFEIAEDQKVIVGRNKLNISLFNKLHKKLTMVMEAGWSLASIEQLVEHSGCISNTQPVNDGNAAPVAGNAPNDDKVARFEVLLEAIVPIYEYGLKEYESNLRGKDVLEILAEYELEAWATEIHGVAIHNTFKGSCDKSLEQLIGEIHRLNTIDGATTPAIGILADHGQLREQYEQVIMAYNGKSSLSMSADYQMENLGAEECKEASEQLSQATKTLEPDLVSKVISSWQEENIRTWAEKLRDGKALAVPLAEKIAVVKRAVEISSGFPPRDIQLLSLLIMLNPEENKGRLAQINTGEGKTTIVAMLAAIKALEGHKVDIITSSPELAKPQSEQQKAFFAIFGLTVAHNSGAQEEAKKEVYRKDIVYGAAGDFQGDILRDEYSKLGTRSGRVCDVAIVDEVDSMLIDGKNHMVMLSTAMPAMDHLEPILAAIWLQIKEVVKKIVEHNGAAYFVESDEALDENGNLIPDLVDTLHAIKGSKEEFIKLCIERHIRRLLRDDSLVISDPDNPNYDAEWNSYIERENRGEIEQGKEFPKIDVPNHLRELVLQAQLPRWIDSAIDAKYRYKNRKHYIHKNGKIAPVDSSNTGVVQQNMHWDNGLHQFLQIKHGTKITPEGLTTNFISNVTYFQRYRSNLYGLTGTLGSESARDLLASTYKVDSVIIPPFRQKQYQELMPIINDVEDSWYQSIIESSLNKLRNGRSVLVITEYIATAEEVAKRLTKDYSYDAGKVKLYKTSEDSHVTEEILKPGEIIIATNIAGRGTDIKPDTLVERNGGLHVCVTFMPDNARVEQQNIGRTSRTGNKGTAQFILHTNVSSDLAVLREIRDAEENKSLETAHAEIKRVTAQDAVFVEFCRLLDRFSYLDREDPTMKAIEERFGIWLKMQKSDTTLDAETISSSLLARFEREFREKILSDERNKELIKNPAYYVLKGNKLLQSKKYEAAIREFSQAIELDQYFQVHAYYNRGYARIAKYGNEKLEIRRPQVKAAINDFVEAKKIIEDRLEPMLSLIQKASGFGESGSPVLSEQVQHKMTIYNVQKNAIEQAIGIGEEGIERKKEQEIELIKQRARKENIDAKRKELGISLAAQKPSEKEKLKRQEQLNAYVATLAEPKEEEIELIKQRIRDRKIRAKREELGLVGITEGSSMGGKILSQVQLDIYPVTLPEITEQEIELIKQEVAHTKVKKAGLVGRVEEPSEETKLQRQEQLNAYVATLAEPGEQEIELIRQRIRDRKTKAKREELGLIENQASITRFNLPCQQQVETPNGEVLESTEQEIELIKQRISEADEELWEEVKLQKQQQLVSYIAELPELRPEGIKEVENRYKEINEENLRLQIGIVGQALQRGHGISIELEDIESCLPEDQDVKFYSEEIDEFRSNGFYGSFRVTEIKPIPWWSVAGMGLLALGQIIGGAALAAFSLGAGSNFGMGLITEGISDLITAVKDGIINRSLDWAQWAIQKAISITVSIVCAGIGAIKDVAKTTMAGARAAVQGSKVLTTQTMKNGWKLAAKAIGSSLAKSTASEVLTQLADYGVSKQLMPHIEKEVIRRIEGPIQEALANNDNVKKMLELDSMNRNKYYQNLIKRKALEILHSQGVKEHALLTITKGIAKGVACNKIAGLSTILQAKEVTEALAKLVVFVPKFIEQLEQGIASIIQEEQVEERYQETVTNDSTKKQHNSKVNDNNSPSREQDSIEERKESVKEKVGARNESASNLTFSASHTRPKGAIDFTEEEGDDLEQAKSESAETTLEESEITSSLSSNISAKMCDIIRGGLITPLVHNGINFGMGKFEQLIGKSVQHSIGTFQAERKLYFMQSGDSSNRVPKKFKSGAVTMEAMGRANEIVSALEGGSEAGLMHLGALSDITGQAIAIYDKKGRLVETIGDNRKKPIIKVQHTQNADGTGHWMVPGNPAITERVSGNNCLFAAVAAQCSKKDHQALRLATAEHMRGNIANLAYQIPDMERVEKYKKIALREGGARYMGTRYHNSPNMGPQRQLDPVSRVENALTAETLLDDSHDHGILATDANGSPLRNQRRNTFLVYGHPRAHVSRSTSTRTFTAGRYSRRNVESYSFGPTNTATGFLNRAEQNMAVHYALRNQAAVDAMHRLNDPATRRSGPNGRFNQVVEIPIINRDGLPQIQIQAGEWVNGVRVPAPRAPRAIRLVLRHRRNQENNPDADVHVHTAYPVLGLNDFYCTAVNGVSTYFSQYTLDGIQSILQLKLAREQLAIASLLIGGYTYEEAYTNIHSIFFKLHKIAAGVALVPLTLYYKHAVGIMLVKQNNEGFKAFYIDPENNPIPVGLEAIFKGYGYELEQLPAEQQRYTNCGPEVIENFMLYLTGERLSQEAAIMHNSLLVEQELMQGQVVEAELLPLATSEQELTKAAITAVSIKAINSSSIMPARYFAHALASHLPQATVEEQQIAEVLCELRSEGREDAEKELVETNAGNKVALESETNMSATKAKTNKAKLPKHLEYFMLANKLSNEGWLAESSEDENAGLVATAKFTQALELYVIAIELEPTNTVYQQAFNVISLKVDGNKLFSEGVALAELAYQMQEELIDKEIMVKEEQVALINKCKAVIELYQAAQNRFCQGLIISHDLRFQTCIEIVEESIETIQAYFITLEEEGLQAEMLVTAAGEGPPATISDTVAETNIATGDSVLELFTDTSEVISPALLGDSEVAIAGITEYYLAI